MPSEAVRMTWRQRLHLARAGELPACIEDRPLYYVMLLVSGTRFPKEFGAVIPRTVICERCRVKPKSLNQSTGNVIAPTHHEIRH